MVENNIALILSFCLTSFSYIIKQIRMNLWIGFRMLTNCHTFILIWTLFSCSYTSLISYILCHGQNMVDYCKICWNLHGMFKGYCSRVAFIHSFLKYCVMDKKRWTIADMLETACNV